MAYPKAEWCIIGRNIIIGFTVHAAILKGPPRLGLPTIFFRVQISTQSI